MATFLAVWLVVVAVMAIAYYAGHAIGFNRGFAAACDIQAEGE